MIILDAHTWFWLVSGPSKLSQKAHAAINYAPIIGVCPISCWEIATKVTQGKLILDREIQVWVQQALARPHVALTAISAEIAITASQLRQQGLHGDPADRLITATATEHGAELVTKDQNLRAFSLVRTGR